MNSSDRFTVDDISRLMADMRERAVSTLQIGDLSLKLAVPPDQELSPGAYKKFRVECPSCSLSFMWEAACSEEDWA